MTNKSNQAKRNSPKKFNRAYLENSIWVYNYYAPINFILFSHLGEIWTISTSDSIEERREMLIGSWEFTNNTLSIKVHEVPNQLVRFLSLGSYIGFPSRDCSSINFKRLRTRKKCVNTFSINHNHTANKTNTHQSGCRERNYLENFVAENNEFPRLIDKKNLLYKEPFYLFIDTETNGLPDSYPDPSSNPNQYPEIIQIAVICCDSEGNRICQEDQYFYPYGWEINEETRHFLHIDESKMREIREFGAFIINPDCLSYSDLYNKSNDEPIDDTLEQLFGPLSKYEFKYIIGHNLAYDLNCLLALYYRHLKDERYSFFTSALYKTFIKPITNLEGVCTMKAATDFCGIETNYGYKYPKLKELYKKLFSEDLDNAHDAKDDVYNTAKCYWRLRDLGIMDGISDGFEIDDDDFLAGNYRFSEDGKLLDSPIRVKIIDLTPVGESDAFVRYEKYIGKDLISSGKAYCPNVDGIEIDDDDFLAGNYRFSEDGKVLLNPVGDNS